MRTHTLNPAISRLFSPVPLLLLAIAFALSGCGEPTEPEPVAVELARVSGAGQEAVRGALLADSLVVIATDASGPPVEGVEVQWSVITPDSGQVEPSISATNARGIARAAWTLGAEVGEQRVRAAAGGEEIIFRALATPPPPEDWAEVIDVELEVSYHEADDRLIAHLTLTNRWTGTVRIRTYTSCLGRGEVYTAGGERVLTFGPNGCLYWVETHPIAPGDSLERSWSAQPTGLQPGEYTVRFLFNIKDVNGTPSTLADPEETVVIP